MKYADGVPQMSNLYIGDLSSPILQRYIGLGNGQYYQ